MYINREISWLDFNQRVLDQVHRNELPLLERLKFLSITASNLDEFFQVRVGGLTLMQRTGKFAPDAAGLSPAQQLGLIRKRARVMIQEQYDLLNNDLMPLMEKSGLQPHRMDQLTEVQLAALEEFFHANVAALLTPLAMEVEQPPVLPSLSIILGAAGTVAGEHGQIRAVFAGLSGIFYPDEISINGRVGLVFTRHFMVQ